MSNALELATRYFDAIGRQDLDSALAHWATGAIDHMAPVGELRAPEGVRAHFEELFAAMPDFQLDVVDFVVDGELVGVHWRAGGTFTGSAYQGIRATGTSVRLEGADIVRIGDGLIQRVDSYWDDSSVARQLGLLPPRKSRRERALLGLFNLRTRLLPRGRKRERS